MRIITLIVLYNPKAEMVAAWKKCSSFSLRVIFVDNSAGSRVQKIKELINQEIQNNDYIPLNENKGIAYAQKTGMKLAEKYKPDFVLTMDQDSEFPAQKIDIIKQILKEKSEKYGIIGLNFQDEGNSLEIIDVKWWLSSGNFINFAEYHRLKKGFDERLFIDAVDADLCHQFYLNGLKVGYIKGIFIRHKIGNPKKINVFSKIITCTNHPPIRYYYMFRNTYYLYSTDKKFFKEDYNKVRYNIFFKVLLFEKNKLKKLKAMKLGKRDGKDGILGKCKHKEILNNE